MFFFCFLFLIYRADGLVDALYDHMVKIMTEINKNERVRKEGSNIYDVFRLQFVNELKNSKVRFKTTSEL